MVYILRTMTVDLLLVRFVEVVMETASGMQRRASCDSVTAATNTVNVTSLDWISERLCKVLWHKTENVKFSRTPYRALGPELIPVCRQSFHRWQNNYQQFYKFTRSNRSNSTYWCRPTVNFDSHQGESKKIIFFLLVTERWARSWSWCTCNQPADYF